MKYFLSQKLVVALVWTTFTSPTYAWCIKGNIKLDVAGRLYTDLKEARPHLAVDTCLHLLYLVTPYELTESIYYTASAYHKVKLLSDFNIKHSLKEQINSVLPSGI